MCTAKISRKVLLSSVTNSPFSVDSCGDRHACFSLRVRQSFYTCLHFPLLLFSLFDPLFPRVKDIPMIATIFGCVVLQARVFRGCYKTILHTESAR